MGGTRESSRQADNSHLRSRPPEHFHTTARFTREWWEQSSFADAWERRMPRRRCQIRVDARRWIVSRGTSLGRISDDPFLNVVRALAGPEFDDPEVGETVRVKRVLFDDGFDLLSTPADR